MAATLPSPDPHFTVPFSPTGLPVEAILPRLDAALAAGGLAVLQAEPGAGKTTLVPPALFRRPWLDGQKILMLQPRRIAARSSAERIAELLGEPVGRSAGYRISLESRVSAATRIEVLTEGILTRMIQDQPDLPGVGLIIFDEFHERSQHADLALALALEVRSSLRPDLAILVMSATIDTAALANLLGNSQTSAPVIDCPGRSFPVRVEWRPPEVAADGRASDFWRDGRAFLAFVAGRVREGIAATPGDILVFLPGQGEINRIADLLSQPVPGDPAGPVNQVDIIRLHGSLAPGEQGAALRPGPRRRVILATNVAETSLTIPGITLVIDSGLVRVNRFDARLGMDRLVTERVSQASSRQRQGRAGRVAAGLCWKLWPETERLDPWLPPEVERADLADFVLTARAWGTSGPDGLRMLSPPAAVLWNQAENLLRELGALDATSVLTTAGRSMAALGLHPRLARLVLAARAQGPATESLAWACAALLGDRDVLSNAASSDFRLRLGLIGALPAIPPATVAGQTNHALLQRCRELWLRNAPAQSKLSGSAADPGSVSDPGPLLALAWPDRIGRRETVEKDRQNRLVAHYQLSNGRRAILGGSDAQDPPPWLVAIDAEAGDQITTIRLYAAITVTSSIEQIMPDLVHESLSIEWDSLRPRAARQTRIGQLVVSDKPLPANQLPRTEVLAAFREHFFPLPVSAPAAGSLIAGLVGTNDHARTMAGLPWTDTSRQLLTRLQWAHGCQPGVWPDCIDETLALEIEEWLLPQLKTGGGLVLDGELLHQALTGHLGWSRLAALDREVPTHWQVPSGSRRPLEYPAHPAAPILAVRIQEVFGMESQPRILGVPVQLHLLSPAQRPLQVTSDLTSFWTRTYPEIRKEMRGRYPRHYWPDNPLEAEPTSRAKPRGT